MTTLFSRQLHTKLKYRYWYTAARESKLALFEASCGRASRAANGSSEQEQAETEGVKSESWERRGQGEKAGERGGMRKEREGGAGEGECGREGRGGDDTTKKHFKSIATQIELGFPSVSERSTPRSGKPTSKRESPPCTPPPRTSNSPPPCAKQASEPSPTPSGSWEQHSVKRNCAERPIRHCEFWGSPPRSPLGWWPNGAAISWVVARSLGRWERCRSLGGRPPVLWGWSPRPAAPPHEAAQERFVTRHFAL